MAMSGIGAYYNHDDMMKHRRVSQVAQAHNVMPPRECLERGWPGFFIPVVRARRARMKHSHRSHRRFSPPINKLCIRGPMNSARRCYAPREDTYGKRPHENCQQASPRHLP